MSNTSNVIRPPKAYVIFQRKHARRSGDGALQVGGRPEKLQGHFLPAFFAAYGALEVLARQRGSGNPGFADMEKARAWYHSQLIKKRLGIDSPVPFTAD